MPADFQDQFAKQIDQAVEECEQYSELHRKSGRFVLTSLVALVMTALMTITYFSQISARDSIEYTLSRLTRAIEAGEGSQGTDSSLKAIEAALASQPQSGAIGSSVMVAAVAALSVIVGVLVALYRFHLTEVSRTQHYKFGFMRLRIAVTNTEGQLVPEALVALTDSAFSYETAKRKKGDVESPVPGHPGSDLSAAVLNKLLTSFEVKVEAKKGG